MKRFVAIAAVVVIVAVAGAAVWLLDNLNGLVADAIETYGSEATGTPVRVASVDIRLREGRGTVRGLEVGNPDGFATPNALTWDEVTIDIDPSSLRASPYVVDEVRIEAPVVSFAINERGQANLRELQKRLRGGSGSSQPAESASGEEPRLRIRSFTFEKGRVDVQTAKVGGKNVSAELPALRLENLGGANGATPQEIGRQVLAAYTGQVLETVARRELDRRVEDAIDEHLGDAAGEAAKGLLNRLRDD